MTNDTKIHPERCSQITIAALAAYGRIPGLDVGSAEYRSAVLQRVAVDYMTAGLGVETTGDTKPLALSVDDIRTVVAATEYYSGLLGRTDDVTPDELAEVEQVRKINARALEAWQRHEEGIAHDDRTR